MDRPFSNYDQTRKHGIVTDQSWYEAQYSNADSEYSHCYAAGIPRQAQEENGFFVDYTIALLNLNPMQDRILDLGSGYGYAMDAWERRGFNVTGMEWSSAARDASGKRNMVVGDIRDLSRFRDGEFAVVYSQATLEHLVKKDIETVVTGIHRIATYGVHYVGHEQGDDPSHISCVSPDVFFEWLRGWMSQIGGGAVAYGNPVQPMFPIFITAKQFPLRIIWSKYLEYKYSKEKGNGQVQAVG